MLYVLRELFFRFCSDWFSDLHAMYFANFWIWFSVVRVICNIDLMMMPSLLNIFSLQFCSCLSLYFKWTKNLDAFL